MNARNIILMGCCGVLSLLWLNGSGSAQDKHQTNRKSSCSVVHPESICSSSNTCGSASTPCTVDVKRTSDSASTTANIVDAKANAPFCLKAGTKVTWQSSSKETGFLVDFGSSSPFEPSGAVIGGSDRSVTVTAKTSGCYKYSAGACVSGAINGMCDSIEADFIVLPNTD